MRVLSLFCLLCGSLQGTTFYITVAGMGGEMEYDLRFSGWAKDIDKVVRAGGPDVHVDTLYGPAATKDKVKAAFADVAKTAKGTDSLVVMLIGHGTFDGSDYKINLPDRI